MKTNMTFRRILSLFLCCCMLLVVCACAAEEAKPPVSEREASSGESTLSLEQISQLVSESSSGTVSEPFVPNLTVPEERETVLEHIATLETGINGAFEYGFMFCEDGSVSSSVSTPLFYCADEEGNIYTYWDTGESSSIIRLNDGASVPYSAQYSVYDMEYCGDSLFILFMDGSLHKISMENGFENLVLTHVYHVEERMDSLIQLLAIGLDEPVLGCYENLYERLLGIYSLDGIQIPSSELIYTKTSTNGISSITINGKQISNVSTDSEVSELLGIYDKKPYVIESCLQTIQGRSVLEQIYSIYNIVGTIESKFLFSDRFSNYKPCSIPFTLGQGGEVTEYRSRLVKVGETIFEDILDSFIVSGKDGALYLVLYYPNEVELYRIDPGYSDVQFSDFTTIEESGQGNISEEIGTGGNGAVSPMSTVGSSGMVGVTRSTALSRAKAIIGITWTLQSGHRITRGSDTRLPSYLSADQVGKTMTGIPYCWGGFNGLDDESTSSDTKKAFLSVVNRSISSSYGSTRYMAGNTLCTGGRKAETIGLDCSGFVSSVYDFTAKAGTSNLVTYGHTVSSIDELQEMDLIVKSGEHCLLYAGKKTSTSILVYDCSVETGRTTSRWFFRSECEAEDGYLYIHPFQGGWGYSSTQHWRVCDSCGDQITSGVSHTMSLTYQFNATYHWLGCTEGCGYTVKRAAHTYNSSKRCTVCGTGQAEIISRFEQPVESEEIPSNGALTAVLYAVSDERCRLRTA